MMVCHRVCLHLILMSAHLGAQGSNPRYATFFRICGLPFYKCGLSSRVSGLLFHVSGLSFRVYAVSLLSLSPFCWSAGEREKKNRVLEPTSQFEVILVKGQIGVILNVVP